MCCEGLVCASCANPVVEGRCPVCKAARAQMHHSAGLSPQLLAVLLTALAVVVLLVAHHL
jgi:hypothetical protein